MSISNKIHGFMDQASWIRKMFEEGQRLREQFGEDQVFDLSLGNPVLEPPEILLRALAQAAADTSPGLHRYMPNAGYTETREAVAAAVAAESGFPLTADHVVMVCGAAGGLNIALKTLLDPGDEVIVFTPYFVEYLFYADNHGGRAVPAPTQANFTPDLEAFRNAVTPRTKAVIINSPNNPTGVVYSPEVLTSLAQALREKSKEIGRPIYLISDDPYGKIVFDDMKTPHVFQVYDHSLYITSHSKDLAVPGERIGCVAVHPRCADSENVMGGLIFCNRVLGFVNAPALMQRVVRRVQGTSVDVQTYRRRRDFLYAELTRIGYDVVRPQGAFYVFPRSPLADELEFVKILTRHRVLVVPGRGFGTPGYFRIAYCMPDPVIEGALQGLEAAFREIAG